MGCCQSVPVVTVDVPQDISTTDLHVFDRKSFTEGCKLLPSTAACPASFPYEWLPCIVAGAGHLFVAAFEGVGGADAAHHCRDMCYDVFMASLRSGMDPEAALRSMWLELDRSYLQGPLPDHVKAYVGATGSAVFIDTCKGVCYSSRLGSPSPFLARIKGAFSSVRMEVQPLAANTPHSATFGEMVRQQLAQRARAARHPAPPSTAHAHHHQLHQHDPVQWQAYALPDELQPGSAGRPVPTRCVGCGYGKEQRLLSMWMRRQRLSPRGSALPEALPDVPFFMAECEVTSERLTASDEMVMLCSHALEQLVSPQEAALMGHTFGGTKLAALNQTFMVGQQPGDAPPGGAHRSYRDGPRVREGNVASAVVYRAMAKALERHNRQYRQRLDSESLKALPLSVDMEALRPVGPQGDGATLRLPPTYPTGHITKHDVHGDVGVVVIYLDWPGTREAIPRSVPQHSMARQTASGTPGQGGWQRRGGGPAAAHRWELIRLLVRFAASRRRQLLEAWWGAVEGAVRQAEEAARVAEVAAWKTLGQAVQVTRRGEVYDPDTPPRQAPKSPVKAASSTQRSFAAKLRSSRTPGIPGSPDGKMTASYAGSIATMADTTPSHSPQPQHTLRDSKEHASAARTSQPQPSARGPSAGGRSPSPPSTVVAVVAKGSSPSPCHVASSSKISLRRKQQVADRLF